MDVLGVFLAIAGTIIWGSAAFGWSAKRDAILSSKWPLGFDLNRAADLGRQRIATTVGVGAYTLGVLMSLVGIFGLRWRDPLILGAAFVACVLLCLYYFCILGPAEVQRSKLATVKYFYFDAGGSDWNAANAYPGWTARLAQQLGYRADMSREELEAIIRGTRY